MPLHLPNPDLNLNLNERLMGQGSSIPLLTALCIGTEPPTLQQQTCVVTFYAGPMGLSLFPVRPPSQQEAEQLDKQCWGPEGHVLRREGTHLAGSVCAIIVTYPMVHTAFSSSSLFKVISVWLIYVCMGVILSLSLSVRGAFIWEEKTGLVCAHIYLHSTFLWAVASTSCWGLRIPQWNTCTLAEKPPVEGTYRSQP